MRRACASRSRFAFSMTVRSRPASATEVSILARAILRAREHGRRGDELDGPALTALLSRDPGLPLRSRSPLELHGHAP